MSANMLSGAGLGLRRALLGPLELQPDAAIDFMEVAPENWIGVGGRLGRRLRAFTERHPFACHGLSLSLGGPAPLDETLLLRLRRFLDEHQVVAYSEHLSYCSDDAHLYDLMPIPFTRKAVAYVAERIRRVQDALNRRIAIENVSFYTPLGAEMSELDFVCDVLREADCDLLLDVNNVYVNSVNHRYDPMDYIDRLAGERIAYMHIAGHYREADDLIVDTHAAPVVDPVWALLDAAYARHGVRPTLLERDFHFPPVEILLAELERIRSTQRQFPTAANPRIAAHG
jgi:uncharacterized protein (UPF0276 family)